MMRFTKFIRPQSNHQHSRFLPISSSAGQHFVDTDDVEGMQAHTDVETILTAGLHHVLVSTDTGSLQSYTEGMGGDWN